MTDSAAAMTTLLQQLTRLLKHLPDHAGGLVSGSSKVALISADQQIVNRLPGMAKAERMLQDLPADEKAMLEAGKGRIVFLPPGSRVVHPLDLETVAAEVREAGSADGVVRLLDSDRRMTMAKLKDLGAILNIDVPASLRRKADAQWHLAQVLAGHQSRTAAARLPQGNQEV